DLRRLSGALAALERDKQTRCGRQILFPFLRAISGRAGMTRDTTNPCFRPAKRFSPRSTPSDPEEEQFDQRIERAGAQRADADGARRLHRHLAQELLVVPDLQ